VEQIRTGGSLIKNTGKTIIAVTTDNTKVLVSGRFIILKIFRIYRKGTLKSRRSEIKPTKLKTLRSSTLYVSKLIFELDIR
jgi:archaellum component FlaG (FlaF/FlaG flagellin family)